MGDIDFLEVEALLCWRAWLQGVQQQCLERLLPCCLVLSRGALWLSALEGVAWNGWRPEVKHEVTRCRVRKIWHQLSLWRDPLGSQSDSVPRKEGSGVRAEMARVCLEQNAENQVGVIEERSGEYWRGKGIKVPWKVNIGIPFSMFVSICCTFYSQICQSMPEAPLSAISIVGFVWAWFTFLNSWCFSWDFQTTGVKH